MKKVIVTEFDPIQLIYTPYCSIYINTFFFFRFVYINLTVSNSVTIFGGFSGGGGGNKNVLYRIITILPFQICYYCLCGSDISPTSHHCLYHLWSEIKATIRQSSCRQISDDSYNQIYVLFLLFYGLHYSIYSPLSV